MSQQVDGMNNIMKGLSTYVIEQIAQYVRYLTSYCPPLRFMARRVKQEGIRNPTMNITRLFATEKITRMMMIREMPSPMMLGLTLQVLSRCCRWWIESSFLSPVISAIFSTFCIMAIQMSRRLQFQPCTIKLCISQQLNNQFQSIAAMSRKKQHPSAERVSKMSLSMLRGSTDHLSGQTFKKTEKDYFNRRVFTENAYDEEEIDLDKYTSKLGLHHLKNFKSTSNLKKGAKKGNMVRGYSSNKEKNTGPVSFQVPKVGMVISTNNIHQNICIFPEETKLKREKLSKVLLTEPSLKLMKSKDRFVKQQSKKNFDKLFLKKEKKPTKDKEREKEREKEKEKDIELKSNKSKQKLFQTLKKQLNLKNSSSETASQGPDIKFIQKIGEGTFGQVFRGKMNGKTVAIKRVFQDKKYKNRELQILNMLQNDYVMHVIRTYYTREKVIGEGEKEYLNIVMEYYENNLYEYINQVDFNQLDTKLIVYQLFRGLMYIHSIDICHRDIKPHNLLIKPKSKKMVICDFGSAKKLVKGEPNIAYICSRCYRAPELIFGSTTYTTMIDIWSAGCILLEMIVGKPYFIGDSNIDQLVEIIKTLGTPSKTEVINMNPNYDLDDYKFPKIKSKDWKDVFPGIDSKLYKLLKQLLLYSPKQRLNAAEALCHQYFDDLREQKIYAMLKAKYGIPDLFAFTDQQLANFQHLVPKLIPEWYKTH